MHLTVIGGGPSGLYAARLIKLRHPDWPVVVHERNPAAETYGFGVSLSGRAVRSFRDADPQTYERIEAISTTAPTAEFRLPTGSVVIPEFSRGVTVPRVELLAVLQKACADVGVEIVSGSNVGVEDVRAATDLVVAADGAASAVRAGLTDELGVHERFLRNAFIWCAADVELASAVFVPVRTPDGVFTTHSYPFAAGRSGHVIEASVESIEKAGMTVGPRRDGSSDTVALDYLTDAFRDLLGGAPLVGNRSVWGQFRQVECDRWSTGDVVLIGDAAATAHPSLGSGTRLAMESSIALADALLGTEPLAVELGNYATVHRRAVTLLQDRARRSQLWWETLDHRLGDAPSTVAVSYLTRAGSVTLHRISPAGDALVTDAVAAFGTRPPAGTDPDGVYEWVLDQPLTARGRVIDNREIGAAGPVVCVDGPAGRQWADETVLVDVHVDVDDAWGPDADAIVDRVDAVLAAGADGVCLDGPAERTSVLNRLAFAERLRVRARTSAASSTDPTLVAVRGTEEFRPMLIDALVSLRTDLIDITPDLARRTLSA